MFDRLSRSWVLVKQSWTILQKDRELLLFPIFSSLALLALVASFVVPAVMYFINHPEATEGEHQISAAWYGGGFLLYVGLFFITYFFNVAIMHCAAMRMDGGDPTVADGFRGASAKAGKILAWAAVSATVGIILRSLEERLGLLGRIVMSLLGAAFAVVSAFTVPVLVFENIGVTDSVKRAMEVLKQTWGESLVGETGISVVFSWLMMPGIFLIIGAAYVGSATGSLSVATLLGSMGFVYIVLLAIISSTLSSIFRVALYRYATAKPLGGFYSPEMLQQHFVTRRK